MKMIVVNTDNTNVLSPPTTTTHRSCLSLSLSLALSLYFVINNMPTTNVLLLASRYRKTR